MNLTPKDKKNHPNQIALRQSRQAARVLFRLHRQQERHRLGPQHTIPIEIFLSHPPQPPFAMAFAPARHIQTLTLPVFDDSSKCMAKNFIRSVETARNAQHWTEEETNNFAMNKIAGPAVSWLDTLVLEQNLPTTWNERLPAQATAAVAARAATDQAPAVVAVPARPAIPGHPGFKKLFSTEFYVDHYGIKDTSALISTLQQKPSETSNEFYRRVAHAVDLMDWDVQDKQTEIYRTHFNRLCLNFFTNGLLTSLKDTILKRPIPPATIDEMRDAVRQLERHTLNLHPASSVNEVSSNSNSNSKFKKNPPKCYFCKGMHVVGVCTAPGVEKWKKDHPPRSKKGRNSSSGNKLMGRTFSTNEVRYDPESDSFTFLVEPNLASPADKPSPHSENY